MFMMVFGLPLGFLLIFAVLAQSTSGTSFATSIRTSLIFSVVYVAYIGVLAGEWQAHFPLLAIAAFLIGLAVSVLVGLCIDRYRTR